MYIWRYLNNFKSCVAYMVKGCSHCLMISSKCQQHIVFMMSFSSHVCQNVSVDICYCCQRCTVHASCFVHPVATMRHRAQRGDMDFWNLCQESTSEMRREQRQQTDLLPHWGSNTKFKLKTLRSPPHIATWLLKLPLNISRISITKTSDRIQSSLIATYTFSGTESVQFTINLNLQLLPHTLVPFPTQNLTTESAETKFCGEGRAASCWNHLCRMNSVASKFLVSLKMHIKCCGYK